MNLRHIKLLVLILMLIPSVKVNAWEGMSMPELHVEGRYLKDSYGHIVNLHGFAQTYSPWFNEQNSQWNNYNVAACLNYNKGIIDGILDAGWKMNFIRLHMDPYWSNIPGVQTTGEADISAFDFYRFKRYLDEVFIPMAEYAISKGLYVVMRPPGVCPEHIAVGDDYNQYLLQVWGCVAQHAKLKNNPYVMFELANEPVNILGPDGTFGSGTQGHFDNLKTYFQAVVDKIRSSANNILWIPGLGWQSQYQGYALNPIEGENIGYAVHVYPGWFNSGQGYEPFQRGWDNQVQPVADFAPIIVTEMDWAPEKYNKSWGKDVTGVAGGEGFGANFKKIVDGCDNVSWLLFTSPDLLDDFEDTPPAAGAAYTFLNDPEACPWPIYHWYQDYANEYDFNGVSNDYKTLSELVLEGPDSILVQTTSSISIKLNAVFADGHIEKVASSANYVIENPSVVKVSQGRIFTLADGETNITIEYTDANEVKTYLSLHITSVTFPLTNELFNARIWENGTFDETTRTLKTGQWGFGGWQYNGIDLSDYKFIVVRLSSANTADVAFNVYDGPSYWGSPASYQFGNKQEVVVPLKYAKKNDGTNLNPEHIYIAGFWSNGSNPFVIDTVFLSNSSEFDIPMVLAKDINDNEITKITGFKYRENAGPSQSESLVVFGDMLKGDVSITSTDNFEVSLTETDGFASSLFLNNQDGILENTEIFVRLKEGLEQKSYSGSLTITSEGAQTKKVSLSGSVDYPVGIANFDKGEAKVVSTEYYTITGQKVRSSDNLRGLFIQRQLMSNGTVSVSKIFKN